VCDRRAAIILSAGTELTEGKTQDTHVRFIASELTAAGLIVLRGVQVPDNAEIFSTELGRAIAEAGLVIVTGGLGPTADDLTRQIIADAAGAPLEFHPEVWEAIQQRFKGRTISETNRRQAMAPRGFPLILNPNGTAPGFHGTIRETLVVALPGPPGELRPMFTRSVAPLVAERFGGRAAAEILWGTALMVPESSLEEALIRCRREGVEWGTRVEEDRITFSLRGGAEAEREAFYGDLVAFLGPVRIRRGETRPAQLMTDALLDRGSTLVTVESCTGGLIAKYITDIPGSSRVFWGGVVAYSNEAKMRVIGVPSSTLANDGAVSERAVADMAGGALEISGADAALAVSGVAGPDGGSPEKPVGTVWIAAALRQGDCTTRGFLFTGPRDMVRRRAAITAMLFAEARILGRNFLDSGAKW
jgi:nicotinamide-nucleotide amidase